MSNSQSSERPDLQDLVAYMQGRGSEALRAQVLKRLDEDESYLELMMDLVPMLREAGELADPDAVPEAAPAVRPLVSPIAAAVDAPLPPAPEAPPARVVTFPESPSRRRTAAIGLMVAMIPAMVAVWIATRPARPAAYDLAKSLKSVSETILDENNPWGGGATRGSDAKDICDQDPVACFDAGAQMVDLELAIQRKWKIQANTRLGNLSTTLGRKTFKSYFPGLAEVPDGTLIGLDVIEKQVAAGSRELLKEQDLMSGFNEGTCLRAAFLAAKSKDLAFFEKRKNRRLCRGIIDEVNWKPDPDALEHLYFEMRRKIEELP